MSPRTETAPHHLLREPLFVYGWLIHADGPRAEIEPYIDRTTAASVPARWVTSRLSIVPDEPLGGELLWFNPDGSAEALRRLTRIEGSGFELTSVTAATAEGPVQASMFRWRGLHRDIDHYLHAAQRKIAIAEYELAGLENQLRSRQPPEAPISVQADFEGVLSAFDSAVDQLAEALRLGNRSAAGALPEITSCLSRARAWLMDSVVRAIAQVRNDATHAYYDKRPADGLWRVISTRSGRTRDHGDILSFAQRGVAHLRKLPEILACLREANESKE